MFGPTLINGSLAKGEDRPFDEHLNSFLNLQMPMKPGMNLKTQTLENGFARGLPFARYSRKFRLSKVDGLLSEVHADWEDLKEMLSPIEAVGQYNKLLT